MNWPEFWNTILGGMHFSEFAAYFVLMAAGAFVHFAFAVRHSRRKERDTPKKFKFWFMVKDNFFRGFAVLIVMIVMVLYFEDWFDTALNGKMAFVFGLSIDTIVGQLMTEGKDAPIIKKSRNKLLNKYNGQ